MYLSKIIIENFRCFGEGDNQFELPLKPGLNALVGANDCGKSAVIDALRFALGTVDQEWHRLEDTDFYKEDLSREIKITSKFEFSNESEQKPFIEYLTYNKNPDEQPVFYVNWTAKDTGDTRRWRSFRRVEVRSGKNGDGPNLSPGARELLRATYLRPLRDAEKALSAGRGSRLAQILRYTPLINESGVDFDPYCDLDEIDPKDLKQLNILEIAQLVDILLKNQKGVVDARQTIDDNLKTLAFEDDEISSNIDVSGANASDDVRLKQMLEKLELSLGSEGKPGLGSSNLLFIACELLLLSREEVGNKLLLIEEPEGHLHPQRQLQVMRYLQNQAEEKDIQIIITTHSPNLASVIDLENLIVIHNNCAFSLKQGLTKLEYSDYRFLQRFLDVTKANLFFARGVLIVEGITENIILPTLAKIMGQDLTSHGVSIVNVGGVGFRRYARIFQRENVSDEDKDRQLDIPVACITDMDVMPNCAPIIIGKVEEREGWPEKNRRRWRAKRDFTEEEIAGERQKKNRKASGQNVKTFISDEWTLEYDLALGPRDKDGNLTGGLAEDVYVAAKLAANDEIINSGETKISDVEQDAMGDFKKLQETATLKDDRSAEEVIASNVYALFAKNGVSKSIAAQYLAQRLLSKYKSGELPLDEFKAKLPEYLICAIEYVTGV